MTRSSVSSCLPSRSFATHAIARAIGVSSILLVSCSSGSSADTGSSTESGYVAFAPAFENYRTWWSTPGVATGAPTDTLVHLTGPLTSYINTKPPSGSTEFPVGTIIVKEDSNPDITARKVFAMVKRGSGFNSQGAVGWEFFELINVDESTVTLSWRGIGPPISNDTYGADPNACNECHGQAAANDFVWTTGLSLTSF